MSKPRTYRLQAKEVQIGDVLADDRNPVPVTEILRDGTNYIFKFEGGENYFEEYADVYIFPGFVTAAKQAELDRIQAELKLRGSTSGEFGEPGTDPRPPVSVTSPLPSGSADRKAIPLWDGVMSYAPAALAEVARTSQKGNLKHNPGEELHHARGKSRDHKNCIARHLVDYEAMKTAVDRGTVRLQDTLRLRQDDGTVIEITVLEWLREELGNMSWRVLIFSQEQLEELGVAPLAPRARLPEAE